MAEANPSFSGENLRVTPSKSDVPHTRPLDEQILDELRVFKPITSERNVWAFWDKGLDTCPAWCQRNIISWSRRLGQTWTVRVLDLVPDSPNNISNYVDSSFFPEAFIDRTMDGPHVGQHQSDLLRLPLLYLYGGVWIDVGMMLFRGLDSLCWNALEDPNSPYEFAGFSVTMGPELAMIFNGFIAARKGSECIKHWHEIFRAVWESNTNCKGMHEHPLLKHLPKYEPPSVAGKRPAFMYAQFADYLAQVFCLERLRHLSDPATSWEGPNFFSQKALLIDCVTEVYWAQRLTNWDGRKQFDLLSSPREGVPEDNSTFRDASNLVNGVLGMSSAMKVSHGLVTAGREYLAELWDKPENSGADIIPGSWSQYLRWASESFEQSKPITPILMPVIKGALLTSGIAEVPKI